MNKKCIGCGCYLQNIDKGKEGYTSKNIDEVTYCERCFKIKNYGEYKKVEDDEKNYLKIYKDINKTNDLVLFLVDIFTINDSIEIINKYIKNKILLVITKKDVLPSSLKEQKIRKFIKNYNFNNNIIDLCIISSNKNYNIDLLFNLINQYKTSKNVYVVGNTNAGKSTFINKMIYNYTKKREFLTTSALSSTTLDINKIKINDELYLIDTPGLIEDGSIYNLVDSKTLKHIMPKKTIKPRTYQLNEGDTINSNNLFRLEYVKGNKNSFTIFISNDIIINKINTITNKRGKELKKYTLYVDGKQDVMINGLCFIKIIGEAEINLYTLDNLKIYVRNSLI